MMESITIYPKNEKQKSLLQSLFAEMKVHFKVEDDETKMSEAEFFAKIERAKEQVERGEVYELTPELKAELFKSIL